MTLKTFANQETATGTEWNKAVDDIPDSICYALTPQGSVFRGDSATLKQMGPPLKLRPVQARYLIVKLEKKRNAAVTGNCEFRLAFGGAEVLVGATTGILNWVFVSMVFDMENDFVVGGAVVDLTGEDVELRLYGDNNVNVRLVEVYGGQSSSVTDYGG